MRPARIVAVTALLIDVLEELADQDMDSMSAAEADTAMMLFPHLADLRDVHALALAEMQGLAPPLLQEAYPAPG